VRRVDVEVVVDEEGKEGGWMSRGSAIEFLAKALAAMS
jgi:hypothetical protein